MATDSGLPNMDLKDLVAASRRELTAFQARQPADGRYGHELFRRALGERQQRAWDAIVDLYGYQARRWASQHASFASLSIDADDIAIPAFGRMWKALPAERVMSFNGLNALLQFLKTCVHSEIMQMLRDRSRHGRMVLALPGQDEEDDDPWGHLMDESSPLRAVLEDEIDRQSFWAGIMAALNGVKERLVVELTFSVGLPPREIYRAHPELFTDTAEVSRIKENILRRLKRSLGGGDDAAAPDSLAN